MIYEFIGPSGIGKSTLVETLLDRLNENSQREILSRLFIESNDNYLITLLYNFSRKNVFRKTKINTLINGYLAGKKINKHNLSTTNANLLKELTGYLSNINFAKRLNLNENLLTHFKIIELLIKSKSNCFLSEGILNTLVHNRINYYNYIKEGPLPDKYILLQSNLQDYHKRRLNRGPKTYSDKINSNSLDIEKSNYYYQIFQKELSELKNILGQRLIIIDASRDKETTVSEILNRLKF